MINEHLLKITGSFPVQEVDTKKTITLTNAEVDIYSEEIRDNQDGTYNKVYKAKPVSFVEYIQENQIYRGKSKGKKSVALRMAVCDLADKLGRDREQFYDTFMGKLIPNIDEIWEHLRDI